MPTDTLAQADIARPLFSSIVGWRLFSLAKSEPMSLIVVAVCSQLVFSLSGGG